MSGFGDMLKKARGERTRDELGSVCGVSGGAIEHWEAGRRRPRPEHVRALAVALGWGREDRAKANALLQGFAEDEDDASESAA